MSRPRRRFATLTRRCLALLAGLCLLPASAKVLYVDARASGATQNGSSWANAFLTIKPALDAASAGDEVWVAANTYTDNVTVRVPGLGLYGGFYGGETARRQRKSYRRTTIAGARSDRTTLTVYSTAAGAAVDGFIVTQGSPGIYTWAPDVTLSNNTVTDNGNEGEDGGGIFCTGSRSVTIADCRIVMNRASRGGGITVASGSAVIVRNTITDNQAGGYLAAGFGGGVSVGGGSTVVIKGNIIAHNAAASYSTYGGSGSAAGGGVAVSGATVTLANNTIAENLCLGSAASRGGGIYSNGALAMANNIVWHNTATTPGGSPRPEGGGVYLNPDPASSAVLTSHNTFHGNEPDDGIATGANGNISADPMFVDPAAGNWRLRPVSPCIDAGGAPTFGSTDLAGDSRVMGARVDMGAYESGWYAEASMDKLKRVLRIAAGLESSGGNRPATLEDAVILARKLSGL